MTACTICGLACPGTDLDDEAVCLACYTANLAGAELRQGVREEGVRNQGQGVRHEGGRNQGGSPDPPLVPRPFLPHSLPLPWGQRERRLPAYARILAAREEE